MADTYVEVVFNLPVEGPFTYLPPDDSTEILFGMRVEAPFRGKLIIGYVVAVGKKPPKGNFKIRGLKRTLDPEPLFNQRHLDLALWVSRMYFCTTGEALAVMIPGGKKERGGDFFPAEEGSFTPPELLSDAQVAALERVRTGKERLYYLFGVTGSGKTEVFLQLAGDEISAGRGVIYLVPEISLTHQLIQQLKARFGDEVAVWHSKLTPSQKLGEWRRIRAGKAHMVVGARSAVFSPLENLGLIILDEEHESSYKSSSSPRYHARQVAMKRCAIEKARLLMGSATPSLEAYHLMKEGVIVRIDLPLRVSGGPMPQVKTIPMNGEKSSISHELQKEIMSTAAMGKQTILFLNRRGFSYFFHCRSCGYEMKCNHCSVNLTLHKSSGKMVCHYCGYAREPISVCPQCGSLDVGYSGFGTEKIEEDIRQLFPQLRIARVDTDSTRKKGSLGKILHDFRNGEYDLLLGTQMVAKGLNFPGVRLVGIVLADSGLNIPDFRAGERTFSLIVQVSGRAGRFLEDGRVLVQTFKAEAPAIKMAVASDLEGFYEEELNMRRELQFPPFYRLFRIVVRGRQRGRVRELIDRISADLKFLSNHGAELLGPSECPIEIIAGNHRYQLILRTRNFNRTHMDLRAWYGSFEKPPSVYLEIDVDPVGLL